MNTPASPDVIDTRLVFRVYAVLVALTGFVLFAWGPMWVGTSLAGNPHGKALIVRFIGGCIMAAGCSAAGFAQIDDRRCRHRALLWFLAAHLVLVFVFITQITGPGIPGPGDLVFWSLLATAILLFYFWQTGDGYRAGGFLAFTELFGSDGPSTDQLRSEYEDRIREAAGQEERNRLARELHDSIKQQIFVMQTSAATAQARFDSDPQGARSALEQLRDAARDAMTEMEAMLHSLRATPLENIGLVEALKRQCEALQLRTGTLVEFEAGPLPASTAFAPGAQQAIFRVAQEALGNIGRHARARSVRVTLGGGDGRVALQVHDDGAGFDLLAPRAGMGIRNMQARAAALDGHLAVETKPGGGTTVRLLVPYARPAADIGDYRRRVIGWSVLLGLFGVRLVAQIVWAHQLSIVWPDLMFLLTVGVIFARVVNAYRRARQLRENVACLESPSHS